MYRDTKYRRIRIKIWNNSKEIEVRILEQVLKEIFDCIKDGIGYYRAVLIVRVMENFKSIKNTCDIKKMYMI